MLVGHGEVHAVDQHAPAFRYIKSLDQLGDRALARTGKADDAHDPAGGQAEAHILQHTLTVGPVAEVDMVEDDVAFEVVAALPGRGA